MKFYFHPDRPNQLWFLGPNSTPMAFDFETGSIVMASKQVETTVGWLWKRKVTRSVPLTPEEVAHVVAGGLAERVEDIYLLTKGI